MNKSQCTHQLQTAVNKSTQLLPHQLYLLDNVLPNDVRAELKQWIDDPINDFYWQQIKFSNKTHERYTVNLIENCVIEDLYNIFPKITPQIQERLSLPKDCEFKGLSLWRDLAGYHMDGHTDNPVIYAAMQIYLFDTVDSECGTVFDVNSENTLVPFKPNTGYLLNNTVPPRLTHWIAMPVPPGQERVSIYAIWTGSKS
jgi:hypothetical protein